MNEIQNEFSVFQFFSDDDYEEVCRRVNIEEAVKKAKSLTESIGAKIGTTQRVIITDRGDDCCFEWQFGKGIIFPDMPLN